MLALVRKRERRRFCNKRPTRRIGAFFSIEARINWILSLFIRASERKQEMLTKGKLWKISHKVTTKKNRDLVRGIINRPNLLTHAVHNLTFMAILFEANYLIKCGFFEVDKLFVLKKMVLNEFERLNPWFYLKTSNKAYPEYWTRFLIAVVCFDTNLVCIALKSDKNILEFTRTFRSEIKISWNISLFF